MNQCHTLTNRILGPRVTLRKAHTLMDSRVIPNVRYSMPLTSFTRKECKNLNTAIDKNMVNKYRYNRHMPRTVLYISLELGGANYPCFEITQDQKGILNMIKQLRWNKTIANDILVVLSAMQFASGLCEPVMMNTTTDLSYTSQGWFTHTRQRLHSTNAQL